MFFLYECVYGFFKYFLCYTVHKIINRILFKILLRFIKRVIRTIADSDNNLHVQLNFFQSDLYISFI